MSATRRQRIALIVAACIGLVMAGWCCLAWLTTQRNRQHWEELNVQALINLHRSWIQDNSPELYNVHRYLTVGSGPIAFSVDTNQYRTGSNVVAGLFRSEYDWSDEKLVYVVARDGAVFRLGKHGKIEKLH